MSEIYGILALIDDVVPSMHDASFEEIINLNKGKMAEMFEPLKHDTHLFSSKQIDEMLQNETEWKNTTDTSKRMIRLLKFMISFRAKEHIEMLNFSSFRQMMSVESLKLIFTKQNFVNFTIQDKQLNKLLNIQGYFLKNFIYFHMRHDMRFKATIDSTMIDMDNPYTRQTIREENRADRVLSPKYMVDLSIEKFAIDMVDKFFPDIAGIWADHTHNAPYYILEFIKIGFEFGFFAKSTALVLLGKLRKITTNLIKLEEGWLDKLNEVVKFSDMIRASNITNLFAKCRENMAYILVQIVVLISDHAFIEKYPKYVDLNNKMIDNKAMEKKSDKVKKVEHTPADFEKSIHNDFIKDFCFNDKEINDSILYITMNYLSNTVYLSFQKSMNPDSREAVEKMFLYVTSHNRDTFLNSLKQIKIEDLRYFEDKDVIANEIRVTCDDLGYSIRKLLELVGMGEFDRITGALNKDLIRDQDFERYLKEYVPSDNPTLSSIIKRLLTKIDEGMRKDDDFKIALVKESIPLQLMCLVDYISEYFTIEGNKVKVINKEIFSKLNQICAGNNYSKSQLFKGDALYHLKRLLYRYDKDILLFINNLCIEDNIGFYLGRDIFIEFLKIYEKFNGEICKNLDLENPAKGLNIENCSIMLLMTKIITKLFKKPFLDDREKLQYALMAQEIIHPSLVTVYFPQLLDLLQDKELKNLSGENLNKNIFKDNAESEMINTLEKEKDNQVNKKILFLQLCFNNLRMFNVLAKDCFSAIIKQSMEEFLSPVKLYMSSTQIKGKRFIEPFGLDAELISYVRIFGILPEQGCMIECQVKFDNFGKNSFTNIMSFISDCIDRVPDYDSNSTLKMEAQIYLFEGIFPLVFKIVNSIRDLTNFDRSQMVQANLEMVKELMSKLNPQIKYFNSIVTDDGQEVVHEGYLSVNKDSPQKERVVPRKSSMTGSQVFKDAKQKANESVNSRQTMLIGICGNIVDFLEAYYEKAEEEHQEMFKSEQDIDHDRFLEIILATKFENKPSDPVDLIRKKAILNSYIKLYYMAKDDYMERSEEPNLMSYFDRNNQNLRGVFNSCLDRLLNRKKLERRNSEIKGLAKDYAITRFWFNPACYAYVNMLTRLLTKSKTARKEFYIFIKEDRIAQEALENATGSKQDMEQYGKNLAEMKKVTGDRMRDHMIGILLRIHTDLLIFLNSNAAQKPLWWVTHQTYEMISMFFKNLCECNFMDFKVYLSEHVPETNDEGWTELVDLSVTEVMVKQLNYLSSTSKISKNKEPCMMHTDQIDKMHAIMLPLINVINETITGPCQANQRILMGWQTEAASNNAAPVLSKQTSAGAGSKQPPIQISPIDGLINMAMRIIDELSSIYSDLAESTLTLLLSMCEGYDREILKAMALKLPSSVLVDRLTRFTKKIYIRELILQKKFEKKAIKKLTEDLENEKTNDINQQGLTKEQDLDPLVSPSNRVMTAMSGQNLETGEFDITEDMETMIEIEDWEDLFDIYMTQPDFSESKQFHYIFKVMILWRTLAVFSRSHESRLEDAKYETEEYFKNKNIFITNLKIDTEDDKKKTQKSEFPSIFYFVSNKIMTEIEVVDPSSKPLKIYFPKAPPCYMLSEEAKNTYREECQITDSNTKMLNLMRNYRLFEILMTYDLSTWRTIGFGFKFLSADAFKAYTFVCWLIGLLLNFVLAAGLIMNDAGTELIYRNSSFEMAVRIIGYLLVGISSLFLMVWFIFKYKQTYLTRLEDYLFDHPGIDKNSMRVKIYVLTIPAFILQAFPVNYTLHILFTVLGLEVAFIFLAVNLLLIVNISKTAKFVLTAIMLHIDQLVLTFILAFFVIFTYSVLLGNNFSTQLTDSVNSCESLLTCFFFTVNLGLRNGGGIADSMNPTSIYDLMGERTVYDITFFMLINVISLNIIFGIIIDTFSQLRDAQNERGKLILTQPRTRATTASYAATLD